MTPVESKFLRFLASQRQGRAGYSLTARDEIIPHIQGLIDSGMVKERRFGDGPGFQLLDAGKEYLGGMI